MAQVFAQLLPLILGAVLAPLWIIIVLLLLASPRGLLKATAFVLGITVVRLLQWVLFATILGASPDAKAEDGGASPVVSTLLMLVGILLLVASYRTWRKEDDPDAPPPAWMQSLEQTPPLKAFGLGMALSGIAIKLWVFTLSAIAVITAADLGQPGSLIAYLIYVILAQSLLIAALLISASAPRASSTLLKGAIDWLTRYNRPISIGVTLFFGVYFFWDGVNGLLR